MTASGRGPVPHRPPPPRAWRLLVGGVVRFLRLFGWRMPARWIGDDVPAGPAVAVFNHTSNIDGFVMADAVLRVTGRWVQPLVKAELFGVPLLGTLARAAGAVPVARTSKEGRAGAYGAALAKLQHGGTVALAPESTITHDGELLPMRHGAARLALEAGVPVLVATHFGCQRAFSPVAGLPERGAVAETAVEMLPIIEGETVEQLTGRIAATMEQRLEELAASHPVGGPGESWWPPYSNPAEPTRTALEQIGRYRLSMSESIAEARERMASYAADIELQAGLDRARSGLDDLVQQARHLSEDVAARARAGTLGEDARHSAEQLARQARARAEQLTHLLEELRPSLHDDAHEGTGSATTSTTDDDGEGEGDEPTSGTGSASDAAAG